MGPIVPPDSWKTFWDNARKHLKADPGVDMPARRSEHIRLLDNERMFDADWFKRFADEKDIAEILEQVAELLNQFGPEGLAGDNRDIVLDRLSFAANGAFLAQPEWRITALLYARQLGAEFEPWVGERLVDLLKPASWSATLSNTPARNVGPLLDMLLAKSREATIARLRESAIDLPAPIIDSILNHLEKIGLGGILENEIHSKISDPRPPAELILCLIGRLASRATVCSVPAEMLARRALGLIENGVGPDAGLRVLNHIRNCLAKPSWWIDLFPCLSPDARQAFADRLRQSQLWTATESNEVLKQLYKNYPDLKITAQVHAAPAERFVERITSSRSYKERQLLLHKIVTIDLPQCSQDIGVARSYGDLRENYEYKAAKEAQEQLMRRREELEKALADVRPVPFDMPAANFAGPGAHVSLRHADGHVSNYAILGEWDHDDALGIISCASALARAVQGHGVGDHVDIPTESGARETCLLESVGPIPEKVRVWLKTNV